MLSFLLVAEGRLGVCVLGPIHQAGSLDSPSMRDKGWVDSSLVPSWLVLVFSPFLCHCLCQESVGDCGVRVWRCEAWDESGSPANTVAGAGF